jgi:hypothetical protein
MTPARPGFGSPVCNATSTDMLRLRIALATALDRYGFLSDDDVDARHSTALKENSMVSRWMGMREMQARRKAEGEKAMANREQKSNREKLKPKKDKSKNAPSAASSYKDQFGKPKRK